VELTVAAEPEDQAEEAEAQAPGWHQLPEQLILAGPVAVAEILLTVIRPPVVLV
jgi:hypothetical protein